MRIYSLLKGIFFGLIFLQIAPLLFNNLIEQYSKYMETRTSIGLFHLKNTVKDASHYLATIDLFFNAKDIKAIVLWINNLDIEAGSAQTLAQEIIALKKLKPKPVITFCENNCTSWSYYIACATDYIIMPPAARIGDISPKKLSEHTDQKLAENLHKQFVDFAIKQRKKLTETNSDQWAQGQLLTGQQALTFGLIDQTGSLFEVQNKIKNVAFIEGIITWITPKEEQPSPFTSLFQQLVHLFE